MQTEACAVGGDHPASGSSVTGVTVPQGTFAGKSVWLILFFCDAHDPDISQYEPGTKFTGKIQLGLRKADAHT